MSAVLRSAVDYGLLIRNPMENVRMPRDRRGRRVARPYLSPQQFEQLITEIAELYASMVYVAIYTGLRAPNWSVSAGKTFTRIRSPSMSVAAAAIGTSRKAKPRMPRLP
jgi:hypothetical protein